MVPPVPPVPPASRDQRLSTVDIAHEIMTGVHGFVDGPIGLGVCVPMTVISPWNTGGWSTPRCSITPRSFASSRRAPRTSTPA